MLELNLEFLKLMMPWQGGRQVPRSQIFARSPPGGQSLHCYHNGIHTSYLKIQLVPHKFHSACFWISVHVFIQQTQAILHARHALALESLPLAGLGPSAFTVAQKEVC